VWLIIFSYDKTEVIAFVGKPHCGRFISVRVHQCTRLRQSLQLLYGQWVVELRLRYLQYITLGLHVAGHICFSNWSDYGKM
jgi:hypothetical protein